MIPTRIFKLFLMEHWIKILIISAVITLIFLAIWGLTTLESFYAQLTIAQLPINILLFALNAFIFAWIIIRMQMGGFSRLKKGHVKGENINVHFKDIIGIDEAKEEAWEVVQLIKDRARVKKIGGKILRGMLLVGPPGCGKTYMAKAIATEANVPFISMGASEFVEIFVGVGASRVRKVFKKARNLAYGYGACIIFIDELDAIGRRRIFSVFGGTEETNSTQNQLLAEMDGIQEKEENVIIIGATNAVAEDVLDPALLRPGRFDRKIFVDRPGLEGREKLFEHYLKKIKYDSSLDIARLARKAVYKSPADIENIIKEAALIATRNKKDTITMKEISEAMERIEMGIKHKKKMTEKERSMVAYHEAGHLLVLYILHPTDDVFKASIISRGGALGAVHHQPREEFFTFNRDRLLADIKVSLGGYMAEQLKCRVTSNGVAMDFQQAMVIAHDMVWKFGMGGNGLVGDYTIIPPTQISEAFKEKLNNETYLIFQQCLKAVEELLTKENQIFDRFAHELLAKEELDYDEIEAIFAEYGKNHGQIKTPA